MSESCQCKCAKKDSSDTTCCQRCCHGCGHHLINPESGSLEVSTSRDEAPVLNIENDESRVEICDEERKKRDLQLNRRALLFVSVILLIVFGVGVVISFELFTDES